MNYKAAANPWELCNGFGSHRLVVTVENPSVYTEVDITLRRRDLQPEKIGVRVVHAESEIEVSNVSILHVDCEVFSILFEAKEAGQYYIYYMPFTITGKAWFFPVVNYMKSAEMRPDQQWLDSFAGHTPSSAALLAVECRTAFDSFYPMEVPMTKAETEAFTTPYRDKPFMLITEYRNHPIMMFGEFPEIWKNRNDLLRLSDAVAKNEYYTFQIAVYAFQYIDDLGIAFSDENGNKIDNTVCTCFNAGGTDCLGRFFKTKISIKEGELLPLWCGVDLEKSGSGSIFSMKASITSSDYLQTVSVNLSVKDEILHNKGDDDIARLTRLRWLNSTLGLNDEYAAGFEQVSVDGLAVSVLGRKVQFGNDGFPHKISSYFTQDCSHVSCAEHPILYAPISLRITRGGMHLVPSPDGAAVLRKGSGSVQIVGNLSYEGLSVETSTIMEYDGHLDTVITVTALDDIDLDDIALVIPYDKSASAYMVGMGAEGGTRPSNWQYHWQENRANNCIWIGSPNAGLHVKLKHLQDVWEIYSYEKIGLPDSWHNFGKGGASVREKDDYVEFAGYSGARRLHAGQNIQFRYSLIITPLKAIDYSRHWNNKYYHNNVFPTPSVEEAAAAGARIIVLHQGGPLLPYINYPFFLVDQLKEQIEMAHSAGLKYKIYYTIRELSNHAVELPVLRVLRDEILREGPGFCIAGHFQPERHSLMTGGPWLLEHLVEGFIPAWQHLLSDNDYDSSVAMTGLSRWHNHYLEGLSWLAGELGTDGIYLDGVGYDRQIMKRVRKVLDDARPGSLIDFHSGNNYDPAYGLGSPICSYLELMPSIDSLWLGEGYDYEAKSSDYWLVEISGIPFGLMGDMLQNGGNQWRGMIFGMTCRYGYSQGGDPTPLWEFWDKYHMDESEMYGYWNTECPVTTSNSSIKATAYISNKYVIIAVASWEKKPLDMGDSDVFTPKGIIISVDTRALGMNDNYILECPAIREFQEASSCNAGDFVVIEPAKGKIFVINR